MIEVMLLYRPYLCRYFFALHVVWGFLVACQASPRQGSEVDVERVLISDAILEKEILSQLRLGRREEITETNLSEIQRLDLRDAGVQDLSGLEYCKNLKYLDIGNSFPWHPAGASNHISSLAPLAELKSLIRLDLSRAVDHEYIRDLQDLDALDSLETFICEECGIVSINEMAGLRNLKELLVPWNEIVEISEAWGNADFELLDLRSNPVEDSGKIAHIVSERLTNADGPVMMYLGAIKFSESDLKYLMDLDRKSERLKIVWRTLSATSIKSQSED